MFHKFHFTLLATLAVLNGCAAPSEPHPMLAITARVTEREHFEGGPAKPGSTGIYRPGMGGALGGLVAGVVSGARKAPAYWSYTIKSSDGSTRSLSILEEYDVGACISVFTTSDMARYAWWSMSEVTVRVAPRCD